MNIARVTQTGLLVITQTNLASVSSTSTVSGSSGSINRLVGSVNSASIIIGYSNNSGAGSVLSTSNVRAIPLEASPGSVSSISIVFGSPNCQGNVNSISVISGTGHILNLTTFSKTDTISFTDTTTKVKWKPRSLVDNVSFNDSVSRQTINVINLLDTLDFDDTLASSGFNVFIRSLIDPLTFTAGNGYISAPVFTYVSSFIIPAGQTSVTFKLVPSNVLGNRDISIITSPSLNYLYGSAAYGFILSRSYANGLSPSNETVGNVISISIVNGISNNEGIGDIISESLVNGYSILWTGSILGKSYVNAVGA